VKTIVYQSYRTVNVPAWIGRCMPTVRDWAAAQGFDYRFIDDRLFEYAPPWYRRKVGDDVLLVSDLARLEVAKELLAQGFDRTVWVDADVVVFAPEQFTIDITEEYAFCREVWVAPGPDGKLGCSVRVNNAVSVYLRANHFLDFYIHACQWLVRHKPRLGRWDAGTRFLTVLHDLMPFRLLNSVGLLSPVMMADIARGAGPSLPAFMACFGAPLGAANLCASVQGAHCHGVAMGQGLYETVIDKLLRTRGEVINQYYRSPAAVLRSESAGPGGESAP
jgi:hypothetical protein